ncbi:DNA sulfur modification protein DndD [Myroides marinus]|uniref:DNA sulfur modification protein DndD n=1 Tax=Myroides marinus TaxID=703342 RepID=UPI002575CFFB|nr:DNA sulfur modification protein DndD [Myroides marinus]MDM1377715.1 DNA sulfur modification protein DndD [Myroides marinus]MDM1385081.1 DNA sulfur modification protein DndD [Myroides marinus]MDM1392199.1 DNA sulfur modification protein DndD [Myroides marinus]
MKINRIKFHNFRIYKGDNEVLLNSSSPSKNINIIAGKNGFGKTTFLTSLIWCLYGKMMVEVEDKYRRDVRNAGGYEKFLLSLTNRDFLTDLDIKQDNKAKMFMEVEIKDLTIPAMPCNKIVIRRTFNIANETEDIEIFIDDAENELTKEVGYEVFINDFILPREIAKFFFFDAEKIVTLAEAKTKAELRNLSKAYSEVLGIKKYEDLKKNLEVLLTKLRRNGAKPQEKEKLDALLEKEAELIKLRDIVSDEYNSNEQEINNCLKQSEALQEKLIREGSGITVEELQALQNEYSTLRDESDHIKLRLKKILDLVPLVLAGNKLNDLYNQLEKESGLVSSLNIDLNAIPNLTKILQEQLPDLKLELNQLDKIVKVFQKTIDKQNTHSKENVEILLDYTPEQVREVKAVIDNIKNGFNVQFTNIVKEDKNNRLLSSKVLNKIKQAEARKDNAVAQKLRDEKAKIDNKVLELSQQKGQLIEEKNTLDTQFSSNQKVLSEYEKNFKLIETDIEKAKITQTLLDKITLVIQKIKQDKKYSLQKSILLGLQKIMHKNNFIRNVRVNVLDDVIDIDLLDAKNNVIDKESLSKGEQQLYATALLKALVDESGIKFPVFIDSPLQKFDKYHSENIIKEFYPSISDQVVLFPLLEKELSEAEYEYLKPNLNKVYMINNIEGISSLKSYKVDTLFNEFNKETSHVHTN